MNGYDPEDHICIYCGGYQEDPENRPVEHIAVDLTVTHRLSEARRVRTGDMGQRYRDDIYDLLCELDQVISEEVEERL